MWSKAALLLILFALPAVAAVAPDGAVSNARAFSAAVSVSHDGGLGTNRLTVACITSNGITSDGVTNTGATYAGVAMTEWGRRVSSNIEVVLWYLVNSATGANNLATTFSGLPGEQALAVQTFTGVHQTTPIRTASTNFGTSTAPTVAPASALNDLVLDCMGAEDDDTFDVTSSVGAGQTQLWQYRSEFIVLNVGSTEPGAAGTTTMSHTLNQSEPWATVAGALIPAATARRRFPYAY